VVVDDDVKEFCLKLLLQQCRYESSSATDVISSYLQPSLFYSLPVSNNITLFYSLPVSNNRHCSTAYLSVIISHFINVQICRLRPSATSRNAGNRRNISTRQGRVL